MSANLIIFGEALAEKTSNKLSFLMPARRNTYRQYLYALALTLIALLVRLAIAPLDGGIQYVTFFPAVAISAVIGGLWPGLFSAMFGVTLASYLFWPPFKMFTFDFQHETLVSNAVFLFDAILVSSAVEAMHRYYHKLVDTLAERKQMETVLRDGQRALNDLNRALAKREREFRTLADNVPDSIIRCDLDGYIRYINPPLERLLGHPAADLLGKTCKESFSDGFFGALGEAMRQVGVSGGNADLEEIVSEPNGELRYHSIRIVAEPGSDGRPMSVLAVGRDVTAQRKAEEDLRLAASVFHSSAEGVLIANADGIIISVNPAFTEITGYAEDEVLGHKPSLLRSDRHGPEFYRSMWDSLSCEGRWQGEIWNRRKGGEAYLEWLTINRIDNNVGAAIRYVSVFHDITELWRKDERIRHLAFHDALTGLPNRSLFMDRLQHAIQRALRENTWLAVMFLDLDRFKGINDTLGHDVGDLLLKEVALRLQSGLRSMDTVARLGGDEFVVLLEDTEIADYGANVAASLIEAVARPMEIHGHDIQIGVSVGIALCPEDGRTVLEMMKDADTAMYAAKSAGRNTYRFFQQEMTDQAEKRHQLETELRHAVANDELVLYYQPKIRLDNGRFEGVEALVRWRHPRLGLVPPADFIPVAEETGLIVELGEWVLEHACMQAIDWKTRGLDFSIAVNVSAKQLQRGDLVKRISDAAAAYKIDPACLQVELTESVLMADPELAIGQLRHLHELGVTIAVDDFGTGYSSLAYLRRLPIDVLKIDSSFVMSADHDEEDDQVVRTIIALGKALKLTVIAEGVETEGQAELLRLAGCDLAQGYLYAHPEPAEDLEAWLIARA